MNEGIHHLLHSVGKCLRRDRSGYNTVNAGHHLLGYSPDWSNHYRQSANERGRNYAGLTCFAIRNDHRVGARHNFTNSCLGHPLSPYLHARYRVQARRECRHVAFSHHNQACLWSACRQKAECIAQ